MFRYLLAAAISHLFVCVVLDPRLVPDFPHVLTVFSWLFSGWGILVLMKPGLFGSAGLAVAAAVLFGLTFIVSWVHFFLRDTMHVPEFSLIAWPLVLGPFLCLCGLIGLRFSNQGEPFND